MQSAARLRMVCCVLHAVCLHAATLHVARCLLHIACCMLHAACCILHVVCCTLPGCTLSVARCLLPTARGTPTGPHAAAHSPTCEQVDLARIVCHQPHAAHLRAKSTAFKHGVCVCVHVLHVCACVCVCVGVCVRRGGGEHPQVRQDRAYRVVPASYARSRAMPRASSVGTVRRSVRRAVPQAAL